MGSKKTKKKNALQLHLDNECNCSIESNPNNCQYQQFIDGWNFTPDVGRGQSSGEVFTPRFIVDKMITDSGMFPQEFVYDYDYKQDSTILETIINNRICEPAVGTGNFISTILYYKLQAAKQLSLQDSSKDIKELIMRSIETLYCFDIDAGNLEVTFRRLTDGNSERIDNKEIINYWVKNVTDNIIYDKKEEIINKIIDKDNVLNTILTEVINAGQEEQYEIKDKYSDILYDDVDNVYEIISKELYNTDFFNDYENFKENIFGIKLYDLLLNEFYNLDKVYVYAVDNDIVNNKNIREELLTIIDVSSIVDTISSSLEESKDNWESFLSGEGVLSRFFEENNIKDNDFFENCKKVLHDNIKLFNGIEEYSTPTMPGWRSIWWSRWDNGKLVQLDSLNNEIIKSQLEETVKNMNDIEKEYYVEGKWSDKKKRSEFNKLKKNKNVLENKFIPDKSI